ncbi:MAG TPA: hypothetical protein VG347_25710 [Verrucomicrobiae bacterium]|nr:hypothetical protein [Verrucomicrobiae bacterium]
MKSKYLPGVFLVCAGILAGVLLVGHHSQPAKLPLAQITSPSPLVSAEVAPATAPEISVPEKIGEPAVKAGKSSNQPSLQNQSIGNVATGKAPAQDPDARTALSLVGADPEAEQYWATAINDPNLPAEERKDLIEDLNEDGLSDPKHPGAQDMPLILNRIRLIEELGPYAMDPVNAKAFDEAYKDLVNLASGGPAD